jgi:hypothetical protein
MHVVHDDLVEDAGVSLVWLHPAARGIRDTHLAPRRVLNLKQASSDRREWPVHGLASIVRMGHCVERSSQADLGWPELVSFLVRNGPRHLPTAVTTGFSSGERPPRAAEALGAVPPATGSSIDAWEVSVARLEP